jgi:hypothetical protein
MFVEECFVPAVGAWVTRPEVMKLYRGFAKAWGYQGKHSHESIFDAIRKKYPENSDITYWKNRERAFSGFKINKAAVELINECGVPDEVLRARIEATRHAEQVRAETVRVNDTIREERERIREEWHELHRYAVSIGYRDAAEKRLEKIRNTKTLFEGLPEINASSAPATTVRDCEPTEDLTDADEAFLQELDDADDAKE